MSRNKILPVILIMFVLALLSQLCFGIEKGKRNPFIPLVTPEGRLLQLEAEEEGNEEELRLEGIMYDKGGLSYAIVNAEVVKIGDWAGGYRVLRIEKNKVIFIIDNQIKEVELKKEEQ